MGRVQRIIEWATREARSKPECALSEKVYRDEPILITASQMRQFLPREYRQMRAIATSPEARFKPSTWIFAQQAKLMAGFEDDYPYSGEFVRYFPTYMAMSEDQLRGYFSWRTKLRRGEAPEGSTSYAFVYIYELLNGAGWESPEEGFGLLEAFYDQYGAHDPAIRRHLKRWMVDFAARYGVSPDRLRLAGLVDSGREEAIALLEGAAGLNASQMEFKGGTPEGTGTPRDALYAAIVNLSTYRIQSSCLSKEHPNEFRRALCGTCAALARYCAAHRKTSFSEGLFGTFREDDYVMFQNAVFYNDGCHPEASYLLPDGRSLACRNGRWRQRRRIAMNRGPKFGAIVKAVDARVREELAMGASLKMPDLPKYMARIVADEARAAVAWERTHKPFELNLDASRLSGIRVAASETCEALLVDEEREGAVDMLGAPASDLADASGALDMPYTDDAPDVVGATGTLPDAFAAQGIAIDGVSLSECEHAWLVALLKGDVAGQRDALASSAFTDDLMADAVNEKLFDYLGDTAVECAADGYAVVEDYREDVKGLVR